MRAPTTGQADKLRILGSGAIVLAPGRGEWGPLVRRGWVEPVTEDDADKRFLPPLRITPAGLRALADAVERDGLPDLGDIAPRPRQLNEAPSVTEFKRKIVTAREERDRAQADARVMRNRLRRAQRALEGEYV